MKGWLPPLPEDDTSRAMARRVALVSQLRHGSRLPELHQADLLRARAVVSTRLQARVQDPHESAADALRPRSADGPGTIVTVFGAKGGIGKSTIATNVAAAIARDTDLRVLLLDLDTRFGDIAIMMDVEPAFTVAELAANVDALDEALFLSALVRHASGAQILAAPNHPAQWGDITAEQMRTLIQFGARLFDYVIVDTPGTFNDLVATAIEATHRVLMVSSLDMASIRDTAHVLDRLEADGFPPERLLLTINQVNRAKSIRAADIPDVVRHPVFWTIPYDEQVVHSTQVGRPVVIAKPKSRAAKQLRGLSQGVAALDTPDVAVARRGGARRWGLRSLLRRPVASP